MRMSKLICRLAAATITASLALSGAVATAQPAGLNLPKLSHDLLSSSVGEDTTPTTTSPTTTPAPDAQQQGVVPDMDFRRYLNRSFFNRQDLEAPISAAEMATITEIRSEIFGDGDTFAIVPAVDGELYETCGPSCSRPIVTPNLEGIQYATNLELLDIAFVSQLPEFTSMPKLHTLRLVGAHMTDFNNLEGSKFPALRELYFSSAIDGVYPTTINTFTQLDSLRLDVNGVGDLPVEITELTTLKKLSYGADDQEGVPASIGNMVGLESLSLVDRRYFRDHTKLRALPESMSALDNLKVIDLHGSKNLTALPPVLLELNSLELIGLTGSGVKSDDPVGAELEANGVKLDWHYYRL